MKIKVFLPVVILGVVGLFIWKGGVASGTHDVMHLSGWQPKSYTPSVEWTAFIASLEKGKAFSFKNYRRQMVKLGKPFNGEGLNRFNGGGSAGYNNPSSSFYEGVAFNQYHIQVIGKDPVVILGVFTQCCEGDNHTGCDDKLVEDWMLFAAKGLDIPQRNMDGSYSSSDSEGNPRARHRADPDALSHAILDMYKKKP